MEKSRNFQELRDFFCISLLKKNRCNYSVNQQRDIFFQTQMTQMTQIYIFLSIITHLRT